MHTKTKAPLLLGKSGAFIESKRHFCMVKAALSFCKNTESDQLTHQSALVEIEFFQTHTADLVIKFRV